MNLWGQTDGDTEGRMDGRTDEVSGELLELLSHLKIPVIYVIYDKHHISIRIKDHCTFWTMCVFLLYDLVNLWIYLSTSS